MYIQVRMVATLITAAALVACNNQASKESGSAEYKTMTVTQENRTLKSEYTAHLQGCQVVEVRPQVSGTITRICFNEGQKVRRGQTLFVIDQVPFRAALLEASGNVSSAKAKLATAKLNLESVSVLRQKNVVSDYDVSAARNELAAAEAALNVAAAQETTARNNLSYTEVKSPVDGVAGMIAYRVGALVSSSIVKPLVTVSDGSSMYAYFSLTESQIVDLISQYGTIDAFIAEMPEVELRMSNGNIYPHNGTIAAVSGIVTEGTGAVTLRADFPNNEGLLRDGGSGAVIISSARTGCIAIPQAATYELQDKVFVYKVIDGKAVSSPVKVSRITGGREYLVEEGLNVGDIIIAEGAGLVKEGAVVNTSNKNPK
ncbi:MAG: efflux RND transporter periplasmic adaptor subunit [Muribaculaceae bacterium]